jgi:Arc/MetJ-type ribon-helix-helix transcriptional regulator
MTIKGRLSATVDEDLLDAAREAVAQGRADNLSDWVNTALRRQAEHDQRMRALDAFVAGYEAEHGEITDDEIEAATRATRGRATVSRGAPARASRGHRA